MRPAQQSLLSVIIVLGLLSLFVTLALSYFIYKEGSAMLEDNLELTMDQAIKDASDFFYAAYDNAVERAGTADIVGSDLLSAADTKAITAQLGATRTDGGLIQLFIFDPRKTCIADSKEKPRGTRYLPTTLPRVITRQLDAGQPISYVHEADPNDNEPFKKRSRCVPLSSDDGNVIAWVFAQSDIRNEEILESKINDLGGKWRIAAATATLITLLMFAGMVYLLRRADEIQRKVNEQARVDMLSLLSSALMHEIKTPLATIDGSGQLLKKHFEDEAQGEAQMGELAGYIVSESERIKDIINTSLGTGHTSEIVPLELHMFTTKTVRALYPSISRKHVTVKNEIPEETYVMAAVLPLRLVFTNLITNAVQAVSEDTGEITLAAVTRDKRVGVQVIDNGKGISKRQFKNLYQLFATDKKSGSGIGLAASAQAVESMKGKIDVKSTVGVGTTFTVWLPAATVKDPSKMAAAPAAPLLDI